MGPVEQPFDATTSIITDTATSGTTTSGTATSGTTSSAANHTEDGNIDWRMPIYGIDDFINERHVWQWQAFAGAGEPGWFYFKVFFRFDTEHGLFGNLLDPANYSPFSGNSALTYLYFLRKSHKKNNIEDRIRYLYKFATTLKSIVCETPWLIKGVNGLDAIVSNCIDLGQDRTIQLQFNTETLDTRIGTLMDMYKMACYDDMNCVEVIPSNLRKFTMYIMVFNTPESTYGGIKNSWDSGKKTDVTSKNDIPNMMSFKTYTFDNCEFKLESLNKYMPSTLSNEQAFKLADNQIDIIYSKVYEHRMNEWCKFFGGSNGIFYNEMSINGYSDEKLQANLTKYEKTEKTTDANAEYLNGISNLPNEFGINVDSIHNIIKAGDAAVAAEQAKAEAEAKAAEQATTNTASTTTNNTSTKNNGVTNSGTSSSGDFWMNKNDSDESSDEEPSGSDKHGNVY